MDDLLDAGKILLDTFPLLFVHVALHESDLIVSHGRRRRHVPKKLLVLAVHC